nr:unnamed protein product [Callosobruchus chinensis]
MSSQEDINPDSSPDSPDAPPMSPKQQEAMFEPKPTPKIIRVLTVMAYVLSVSMAAILLSIYYIFMWEGKPHLGARAGGGGYERNLSIYPLVEGPKYSRYHQNEAEHFRNSSATETSSSHQFLDHNTSNNSDGYFDVGNDSSIPLHINTTQNPDVPEGSTNKSLSKRSVEEGYPFITDTMHNEEAEKLKSAFGVLVAKMSQYKSSPNGVKVTLSDAQQWNALDTAVKFAGEDAKDRLYEPKHKKKLVRVLTVIAYVFFVSLAAIMLSLYYVFLWNGDQKVAARYINSGSPRQQKFYASDRDNRNCDSILAEMQQQFTAVESRPSDVMVSPSPESEAEENVTWPDDYESLEEFKKSSVFIKKLMSQYDY